MPSSSPPNPYIIDSPLDSDTGFFGREDILQEIERTLRYPNHNSVILHGQRKIGKTSLLLALERRLPAPPFFPVYFDLAGKALSPVDEVLHQMAAAAAKKVDMPPPSLDDFKDNPNAFHENFLPALYQALGSERQPIFLLDEFKILDTPEEKLPENAAVRALDDYLYNLLTTQTYTDFVFAAGRRMKELSSVVESGFKADLTRFISVLSVEQARALIVREGVKGIPRYDEAAIKRILALTHGHPYLTQLLCRALYNRAYERSRRKPQVTAEDVEAVIPAILEADGTALPVIWESISSPERITLAAIAGRTSHEGEMLNGAVIAATLNQAGISPDTRGLYQAPENLVNWQMLDQTGNSYSFFVELMRRWVAQKRPLEQVKKEELRLIDPEAEALYQAALRAHKAGNDKQAIDQLYKALDISPSHLPARMLLGTILRDQDQLTEAAAQFEEGYKYDPLAVGGILAATLLLLGAALEKVRNYVDAIAAYKRILVISPGDKTAKTRLDTAQKKLDEQTKRAEAARLIEAERVRHEQQAARRRSWAFALLALILIPLLCLAAWWGYGQWTTFKQTAATRTAEAEIAAVTKTAAAAEVAGTAAVYASQTAAAIDAASTAAAASSATAMAEAAQATPSPVVEATAQPEDTTLSPEAATATAQAIASPQGQVSDQIHMAGSDAMQPLIEELAVAYTTAHPDVQIVIQDDESTAGSGLEAVRNETTDIGLISRELEAAETAELDGLQVLTVVQNDPIAIIGHALVPVDNLTTAQVQGIFAGEITNWSEVGGTDAPIVVVASREDSDTRTAFEQLALGQAGTIAGAGIAAEEPSDQAVRNTVASRPYAIGFTALRYAAESPEIPEEPTEVWPVLDTALLEVKLLALDGVIPSVENADSGDYPITRPFNIVTKDPPNESTQSWIDFILSPEGQQVIERAGHIPAP